MDLATLLLLVLIISFIVLILWARYAPYNITGPVVILIVATVVILVVAYWNAQITKQTQIIQQSSLPMARKRTVEIGALDDFSGVKPIQGYINSTLQNVLEEHKQFTAHIKNPAYIVINEAIADSLKNGKRLRSIMALDIAHRAAKSSTSITALEMALAIEYLHNASLIIDDMPHFDNDLMRRGNPTIHAKYGRAVAEMTSLTMMALAYESVCRQCDQLRNSITSLDRLASATKCMSEISLVVNEAFNLSGCPAGVIAEYYLANHCQVHEFGKFIFEQNGFVLTSGDQEEYHELLRDMINRKTSYFFKIAIVAGWYVGICQSTAFPSKEDECKIREVAEHFGLAYQIADDIGDMEQDLKVNHGNTNYAVVFGVDRANVKVETELALCKQKLEELELWSPVWEEVFVATHRMKEGN